MTEERIKELIAIAEKARDNAYCPYSKYSVGAALLCDSGNIYTGSNVENASYGATICAERSAALMAVNAGERHFKAIAISGAPASEHPGNGAYPCGMCRQVISEFADSDFLFIISMGINSYLLYTIEELFPKSFGRGSLEGSTIS